MAYIRSNSDSSQRGPICGVTAAGESNDDTGHANAPGIGAKHIGLLGSIALTVNNISGAGMLQLPAIVQGAGWLPLVVMVLICWVASSFCAALLADAISRIPGNKEYTRPIEYSTAFRFYLGERWFYATQATYFLSLFLQNVAAIVSTAQVMDSLIADCVSGRAYAYEIYPVMHLHSWTPPPECKDNEIVDSTLCVPFGDLPSSTMLVSLGYAISALVLMPLGLMSLKDNCLAQIISFLVLMACCVQFVFGFVSRGLEPEYVPMFGENSTHLVGTVLFNYAFAVTIPAWLNEKVPSVSVNTSVWVSSTLSTAIFIGVAILGALAYPNIPDDLLQALASEASGPVTQVFGGLFGFFIIGFGIPVFCVLLRYNLVVDGVASPRVAMFLGSLLPWLVSWVLYQGHGLVDMLSIAGIYLNGFTGFLAPAWLSLVALRASRREARNAADAERGVVRESTPLLLLERDESGGAGPVAATHGSVRPLPKWLRPYEVEFAIALNVTLGVLMVYAACSPLLVLIPDQV